MIQINRDISYQTGAIAVMAILHAVGIVGLHSSYSHSFEQLTTVNLFISFLLLVFFHESETKKIALFFSLAFLLGMLVEIIGVQTGFPFGNYYYTPLLYLLLFGVPLIIGVNWFLLSYGIISLINRTAPKLGLVWKSSLAALLMTIMDVLIEPFAIAHKLWVWESDVVPIQNYLAWFFISFIIFLIGFKLLPNEKNKVAIGAVIIFFLFFGLNIILNNLF